MKIYLVRHGESMGNVDKTVYHNTADHNIPLSPLGLTQASAAGEFLKNKLMLDEQSGISKNNNKPIQQLRVWASPYVRTRQTSHQILTSMGCKWDKFLYGTTMPSLDTTMNLDISQTKQSPAITYREHQMLCEQQFGLFDGLEDEELTRLYPAEAAHYAKCEQQEGRFWARMPLGESRFDVANRVHQSFGTFHRDAEKHGIDTIIVVCHGVTLRAFIMQWLHLTPEWFNNEPNPGNGWVRYIEDGEDKGYVFKPE